MTSSKTILTTLAATSFATLLTLGGFGSAIASTQQVELMHVHGLAYSADGKQLLIPSHHGIAAYADGQWAKMPGPEHDYMGFSATHNALYTAAIPQSAQSWSTPLALSRVLMLVKHGSS